VGVQELQLSYEQETYLVIQETYVQWTDSRHCWYFNILCIYSYENICL